MSPQSTPIPAPPPLAEPTTVPNLPAHLLFPFCSSIVLVWGLLLIKRASQAGTGAWTATFVANQMAAIFFSTLWLLGGTTQPWQSFWQPAIIAMLPMMPAMIIPEIKNINTKPITVPMVDANRYLINCFISGILIFAANLC